MAGSESTSTPATSTHAAPAPDSPPGCRIGVDIGGTFTDLLLVADDGTSFIGKTLTTHGDPSAAVETAMREGLAAAAADRARTGTLVHGTTLVTNALIERKGAVTALLTTAGFRDVLEIGREHRYELYDLDLEFPRPLVPRYLRFDVPERMAADGTVLEPLDEAFVRALVAELRDKGVRAVAVCYLNSFRNAAHERRTRELIAEVAPDIRVSVSADVVPEIREFQRTSTTAANVYVQERVAAYLQELQQRLHGLRFTGSFFVMLSSGGIGTPETAARYPVRMLESGPAAGALAAAALGRRAGYPDLLSFDMGGTTAKLCAVENGHPLKAREFEVDRVYRFRKGSGLPIKIPVIDMIEIGAGGGSIARVDALGLLKVGPDSAGADPGPACYGRGGTGATVTDANLILGYFDPDYFLGGEMKLDVDAARRALGEIAGKLGMRVEEVAWGIHQIVNENMANAARAHLGERGADPRALPMYAFGGAGPVHGCHVAELLRLPTLIAPVGAGVGSTFGLLAAPLAFDFVRSAYSLLDALDWSFVNGLFDDMHAEGRAILEQAGLGPDAIVYERTADMRYTGQGHEVSVPIPDGVLHGGHLGAITEAFERTYAQMYGRTVPDVGVEVINWRVVARGPEQPLHFASGNGSAGGARAEKGARPVFSHARGAFVDTTVYDRYALAPGMTFPGPAVVEERESTLVISARGRARVDEHRNVIVEFNHENADGYHAD